MVIGVDGSEAFVKNKTGVETYAFQILTSIAKIDHNNIYLIYLDPRSNKIDGEWPKNFKFRFLAWPFFWTQLGLALATYFDFLDLLFVPGHTLPLLKNPFLKSVITVHDLGAEYLGSMHQIKQRLYLNFMTKFQLKFASKIIAVSESTKNDLVKKASLNKEKIKVIYEGVTKYKNDIQVNINTMFNIEKDSYFLFVGTIQPRKNLIRLIKAYNLYFGKEIKNSLKFPKLVLAGSKGWLADPIYQLVKNLKMEDQIVFLGRVSNAELDMLYQNALCLVYPSLYEGFGLPILEAFVHNCPVITSNLSSMPEVAGNAAILVDPYSEGAIGQAMLRINQDQNLRQQLIKKGSQQVKKFSWDKSARETLKLMEELRGES